MLAEHLDTAILAQQGEHFFQHGAGQCQPLDQTRHIQRTAFVQMLAQQIGEQLIAQPGLGDGARLRRQALHRFALARVAIAIADCVHGGLPR